MPTIIKVEGDGYSLLGPLDDLAIITAPYSKERTYHIQLPSCNSLVQRRTEKIILVRRRVFQTLDGEDQEGFINSRKAFGGLTLNNKSARTI
tara:strand:- start:5 stop:280 length:276 start_codon:yes stop_codon:yes gene_type:complete